LFFVIIWNVSSVTKASVDLLQLLPKMAMRIYLRNNSKLMTKDEMKGLFTDFSKEVQKEIHSLGKQLEQPDDEEKARADQIWVVLTLECGTATRVRVGSARGFGQIFRPLGGSAILWRAVWSISDSLLVYRPLLGRSSLVCRARQLTFLPDLDSSYFWRLIVLSGIVFGPWNHYFRPYL
ncbi:hypothetical protein KI387_023291, partial [Taxus chinensis]